MTRIVSRKAITMLALAAAVFAGLAVSQPTESQAGFGFGCDSFDVCS